MTGRLVRGQIWLHTFKPPDKRRPVLVLSDQEAIDMLPTVTVAPVTSTVRGAPSEVPVGVEEGLMHESAINVGYAQAVDKNRLSKFVGTLGRDKMDQVLKALAITTGGA